MGKWLHKCFSLLIHIIFRLFCFVARACVCVCECVCNFCAFFTYWHFYNWFIFVATLFHKGRIITMIVKYQCLVCNRAVAKNHKTVQCDCDRWVHIACNYLNVHTENSKRINHHGIVYTVLKRKCHSVLLKMNTYKNLCMAKLFHLQIKKNNYKCYKTEKNNRWGTPKKSK